MGKSFLKLAPVLGYRAAMFNLVFDTNKPSLHLWRSLGFKEIGLVPKAGLLSHGEYVGKKWHSLTPSCYQNVLTYVFIDLQMPICSIMILLAMVPRNNKKQACLLDESLLNCNCFSLFEKEEGGRACDRNYTGDPVVSDGSSWAKIRWQGTSFLLKSATQVSKGTGGWPIFVSYSAFRTDYVDPNICDTQLSAY